MLMYTRETIPSSNQIDSPIDPVAMITAIETADIGPGRQVTGALAVISR